MADRVLERSTQARLGFVNYRQLMSIRCRVVLVLRGIYLDMEVCGLGFCLSLIVNAHIPICERLDDPAQSITDNGGISTEEHVYDVRDRCKLRNKARYLRRRGYSWKYTEWAPAKRIPEGFII